MPLFRSTCFFLHRCFFKPKLDREDVEHAGINIPLQDQDQDQDKEENTKLERWLESDSGNDTGIDTKLQPAGKPSCASRLCRIGLLRCEDCVCRKTATSTSTYKGVERQHQATTGVSVLSAGPGPGGRGVVLEIVVRLDAPRQDESLYAPLPLLSGYPFPLVSTLAMCGMLRRRRN